MLHRIMTDAEFTDRNGICCPACGGNDLGFGDVSASIPGVSEELVECNGCGTIYYAFYKITGFEITSLGDDFGPVKTDIEDV